MIQLWVLPDIGLDAMEIDTFAYGFIFGLVSLWALGLANDIRRGRQ